MDIIKANYFGSIIALTILVMCNLIFIFRLYGFSKIEYWVGVIFMLTAFPILYLIFTAIEFHRPVIYYIQLGVMLTFIVAEFLLDYAFKINFRDTKWMVITYAMLFFASTGGMVGIASLSGRVFSILSILLFLTMTFLAFYQRVKTGM
jgi:hypothetical protein